MILGTCNFGRYYNNTFVSSEKAIEMIHEFQKLGGKIIDTAYNYEEAQDIIADSGYQGKIITKAWCIDEVKKSMDRLKKDKIYAVLARDSKDNDLINYLKDLKKDGIIEKYGISIYYPHELRQDVNIVQIAASPLFTDYLPIMSLMADVYVRSVYNRSLEYNRMGNKNYIKDFVIGCDNLEQLRVNTKSWRSN